MGIFEYMGDVVGTRFATSLRGHWLAGLGCAAAIGLVAEAARAHPHADDKASSAEASGEPWTFAGALTLSAGSVSTPGPGLDVALWAPNGLGLGVRGDYLSMGGTMSYKLVHAGFSQLFGGRWFSFHYLVGPTYGNRQNNWNDPSCVEWYPLSIRPVDCGPPDDWEHIDRDFWAGGAAGALNVLFGPVAIGIQGTIHLPLIGDDPVVFGFVGARVGTQLRL